MFTFIFVINTARCVLPRKDLLVLGLKVELILWKISSSSRKPGFVVEWVIPLDPVAVSVHVLMVKLSTGITFFKAVVFLHKLFCFIVT